jgi:hypothetical protein
MQNEEILYKIEHEENVAYGVNDSELSDQRAKAIDFYLGEPFGNEIDGRSQVVSYDVQDTIESALPQLLKIFVAGDQVIEFTPKGPDDQAAANQETDYINHVVMEKNNGFEVFYVWFKDSLLSKNGYVKCYYEEQVETEEEEYQGITDAQLQMLASDDSVEVAEIESMPDPSVNMDEMMQMAMAQGQDPGMIPQSMIHNVKLKITRKEGQIKICNVAPEDMLVSVDTIGTNLQNSRFVQHRTYMDRYNVASEFKLSKKRAQELQSDNQEGWDEESNARDIYSEEYDRSVVDDTVLVKDTYIMLDGKRMRYVVVGNDIIYSEQTEMVPFASITPMIMPHRHIGRSYADLTMDIQLIKSTLIRGQLDNMYLANNGRYAISDRVNLDDMLTSRPGGIVRVQGEPGTAILPLQHAPFPPTSFTMVEYMDNMKEKRTGVTAYNQGLDSNSLNKTASGVAQIMSAAQQRLELVARTFAETGVKDLFLLVHRLVRMNYTKPDIIRLRNQWVEVDPREWKNRKDLTISVGLGAGNKDQQLMHLTTILQMQKEALAVGITSPDKIYNALAKLTQNAGFKNPDEFWTNPANNPPQEPPGPSIEEQMIQAQKEIESMKVQAGLQKDQLQAETNNTKLAAEMNIKQLELELKAKEVAIKEAELNLKAAEHNMKVAEIDANTRYITAQEGVANIDLEGNRVLVDQARQSIEEMQQAMADIQASLEEAKAIQLAPKQIIRDKSGKAVGVNVGGIVKNVIRDASGKIVGV